MAVATNISQLRAADDAADTAIAAQLVAYGVPAHRPRATEDVPDIYAFPIFTLGLAAHFHRTPIGGLEYDIWENCVVSIELFAPRVNNDPVILAGVYDTLGGIAVRVRHAMAPDRLDELNGRLPFHHITRLRPQPDVRGYDDERKLDRHELRYLCSIGVIKDCWPTDPAAYVLPPATE